MTKKTKDALFVVLLERETVLCIPRTSGKTPNFSNAIEASESNLFKKFKQSVFDEYGDKSI